MADIKDLDIEKDLKIEDWCTFKHQDEAVDVGLRFGIDPNDNIWFIAGEGKDAKLLVGKKAYDAFVKQQPELEQTVATDGSEPAADALPTVDAPLYPPYEALQYLGAEQRLERVKGADDFDLDKDKTKVAGLESQLRRHAGAVFNALDGQSVRKARGDNYSPDDAIADAKLAGAVSKSVAYADLDGVPEEPLAQVISIEFVENKGKSGSLYNFSIGIAINDGNSVGDGKAFIQATTAKEFEQKIANMGGMRFSSDIFPDFNLLKAQAIATELESPGELSKGSLSLAVREQLQSELETIHKQRTTEETPGKKEARETQVTKIEFELSDKKPFPLTATFHLTDGKKETTAVARTQEKYNEYIEKYGVTAERHGDKGFPDHSFNIERQNRLQAKAQAEEGKIGNMSVDADKLHVKALKAAALEANKQVFRDKHQADLDALKPEGGMAIWSISSHYGELGMPSVALIKGQVALLIPEGTMLYHRDKEEYVSFEQDTPVRGSAQYKKLQSDYDVELPDYDTLVLAIRRHELEEQAKSPSGSNDLTKLALQEAVLNVPDLDNSTSLKFVRTQNLPADVKGMENFDDNSGEKYAFRVDNSGSMENGHVLRVIISNDSGFNGKPQIQMWIPDADGENIGQWVGLNDTKAKDTIESRKDLPDYEGLMVIGRHVANYMQAEEALAKFGHKNKLDSAGLEFVKADALTDEQAALFSGKRSGKSTGAGTDLSTTKPQSRTDNKGGAGTTLGAGDQNSARDKANEAGDNKQTDASKGEKRVSGFDEKLSFLAALTQSFMPKDVFSTNDVFVLYDNDKKPVMLLQLQKDGGNAVGKVMDLTNPDTKGWQEYKAFRQNVGNTADWPKDFEGVIANQFRVGNPLENLTNKDHSKAVDILKKADMGEEQTETLTKVLGDKKETPEALSGVSKLMDNAQTFMRNNLDLVVAGGAALLGAVVKPFRAVAGVVGATAVIDRLHYAIRGKNAGDKVDGAEKGDKNDFKPFVQNLIGGKDGNNITADASRLLEDIQNMGRPEPEIGG